MVAWGRRKEGREAGGGLEYGVCDAVSCCELQPTGAAGLLGRGRSRCVCLPTSLAKRRANSIKSHRNGNTVIMDGPFKVYAPARAVNIEGEGACAMFGGAGAEQITYWEVAAKH